MLERRRKRTMDDGKRPSNDRKKQHCATETDMEGRGTQKKKTRGAETVVNFEKKS